jgi:hypothetical protein
MPRKKNPSRLLLIGEAAGAALGCWLGLKLGSGLVWGALGLGLGCLFGAMLTDDWLS